MGSMMTKGGAGFAGPARWRVFLASGTTWKPSATFCSEVWMKCPSFRRHTRRCRGGMNRRLPRTRRRNLARRPRSRAAHSPVVFRRSLLDRPPPPLAFQDTAFQAPGPGRGLAAAFLAGIDARLTLRAPGVFHGVEQTLARELTVHGLRAQILHRYGLSGGAVAQRHRRGHLVDVLTTWPARAREGFLEIARVQPEPGQARMEILRHGEDGSRKAEVGNSGG